MLKESTYEKEVFEVRAKAKVHLLGQLAGPAQAETGAPVSKHPAVVYDERGKPRPAPVAYDGTHSDDPDLLDDDADDADANPFPNLFPPLG